MPGLPSSPPKPVTDLWQPDLVRLPELKAARRGFRWFARGLMKALLALLLRVELRGLENFPRHGPAVVVINHLGDADAALLLGLLPVDLEALGKLELRQFPVLGKLMDMYGIIWVHRGQPDRRAIRAALDGFAEGRVLVIAPEGRYSLIHGLEQGTGGAAFLARKADVPIVPVALTGTENPRVYGNMRRLRRTQASLTVGVPFRLNGPRGSSKDGWRLAEDTRRIMETLAAMLPPEYRGVYAEQSERSERQE